MSRIKLLLMTMLATFAVNAVASATASAAHEFKVEGKTVSKTFEVLGLSLGSYDLIGAVKKTKIHIKCGHVHVHGLLFFKSLISHADAHLTFSGCSVTEPAGCGVKEPIEVLLTLLLIGTEGSPEAEFNPATPPTFTEIEVTKCALKGKYTVEGSQICALPKASTELVVHEIDCKNAGSKLKFAKEAATFEGLAAVELESKEKWSGV